VCVCVCVCVCVRACARVCTYECYHAGIQALLSQQHADTQARACTRVPLQPLACCESAEEEQTTKVMMTYFSWTSKSIFHAGAEAELCTVLALPDWDAVFAGA